MYLFRPGNDYSQQMPQMQPQQFQRGQRTLTDPLAINSSPTMGAVFNPFGEAMIAKSPAPMLDPIGYSAGWYKPGSKMGKIMNKGGDPLGLFKSGFGGLLG